MTTGDAGAQVQAAGEQPQAHALPAASDFGSRGRIRRRVRFLRRARELAYRDLGGLVFNLHTFGARNDALVLAKLTTLGRMDTELRTLETALGARQTVTVLREAGVTACPRCAAIHGSEDRFCPNCGLPVAPHADLPIAGSAAAGASAQPMPAAPQPIGAEAPAPQAPAVQAAPGTPPPPEHSISQPPVSAPSLAPIGPGRSPTPPSSGS